jgi:hypothetical protein
MTGVDVVGNVVGFEVLGAVAIRCVFWDVYGSGGITPLLNIVTRWR